MRLIRCNYCGIELDIDHPGWIMASLEWYEASTKLSHRYAIDICSDCEHTFWKEVERWQSHLGPVQNKV